MTTTPVTTEHRVLVLLPAGEEADRLTTLLGRAKIPYFACENVEAVGAEIAHGAGAALLSVAQLTPRAMNRLVEALNRQEPWSDLPLVLVFDAAEESPDAGLRMLDLLEPLGNVAVLQQPVSAIGLVSAIQAALRSRRRQYQVRHLTRLWERGIRHRDRFLSLLAHELRTPLSTIRHATCILGQVGGNESAAIEQRSLIERQTSRLAGLIDEMQDVYQVLAGKVRLQRETIDIAELASTCLEAVRHEAEARRHRLVFSRRAGELYVEADSRRLRQVITHLLNNAVRYTPAGGRVELALGREGNEAVVRVRDTGTGLSPEALSDLFEQFSDADDLERPPEGGLKLGLTMVQALVKLHGGGVSASSGGTGRGSEFVVRLPLARAPVELNQPAAPSERGSGPRRVLVIEDNPDGRDSLRLMLQLWGHHADVAADGLQGVEKALADPPDVALIDIGLPGLDGYQVARHLRADLGDEITLIAMTGYGQPHDRQRALEAGFDAYLVKPVVPTVIQELVASLPARRATAGAS